MNEFSWQTWQAKEKAVLVFLKIEERILLIRKKRGLGQGKINAPGGRLEAGESFAQAGIRETWEETKLQVSQLEEVATLSFAFTDGYGLFVKAFFAYAYEGTPQETEEALPFWHPWASMPWDEMWADDPHWLKPVLDGHYATGKFLFENDTMLTKELEIFRRPPFSLQTLVDNRK